jgi:hypothetical protein
MAFPIRTCVACGEEFELKPDKPGFANRCPECSNPEAEDSPSGVAKLDPSDRRAQSEIDAERRKVMRDLLYRKDS